MILQVLVNVKFRQKSYLQCNILKIYVIFFSSFGHYERYNTSSSEPKSDSKDKLPFSSEHTQIKINIPGSYKQIVTDQYKLKSRPDGRSFRNLKKTNDHRKPHHSTIHYQTQSGLENDPLEKKTSGSINVNFIAKAKKK